MENDRKLPGMLLVSLLFMTGCAAIPMFSQEMADFTHSSVDMKGGKLHSTVVEGDDLKEVIKSINALAEKRGLILVDTGCDQTTCQAQYKKSEQQNLDKTVGSSRSTTTTQHEGYNKSTTETTNKSETKTYNVSISSRIFVYLEKTEGGIAVEMIGVPVVNEKMSCPEHLASRNECTVQQLNTTVGKTLAESGREAWGVDISGQVEADMIQGIMAELSL